MLILDGKELKQKLEFAFIQSKSKIVVISAYVTQPAMKWLLENIPKNVNVTLVCRLKPYDVIGGATSVSALKNALDSGWKVSCLDILHAKIYAIDDKEIFIGSANCTSNGLMIYGKGNLEACTKIEASQENLDFINKVVNASVMLDENLLGKMQVFLDNVNKEHKTTEWPDELFPQSKELWVKDFFWCNLLNNENTDDEKLHDLDILGLEELLPEDEEFRNRVKNSRAVKWLITNLKDSEDYELYFGNISQRLHNTLEDDPTPYRKDVKILLQNLLSYCKICLPDVIEISRPRHSERVRLIDTSRDHQV